MHIAKQPRSDAEPAFKRQGKACGREQPDPFRCYQYRVTKGHVRRQLNKPDKTKPEGEVYVQHDPSAPCHCRQA